MEESDKLMNLVNFDFATDWPKLEEKDDEEFDAYLAELGLLHANRICPSCGFAMGISTQGKFRGRRKWECWRRCCRPRGVKNKIGFLVGTFFEKTCTDKKKVFLMSYLFLNELMTRSSMPKVVGSTFHCVSTWLGHFREVIGLYYERLAEEEVSIGGPGKRVHVDDTIYVTPSKNSQREGWVYGVMEEGSKDAIVTIVKKKDNGSFLKFIERHVQEGTEIVTGKERPRLGLLEAGYSHSVAADSTDILLLKPVLLWDQMKAPILSRTGTNTHKFPEDILFTTLWQFQTPHSFRMYKFWSTVADLYPCY